MTREDIIRMAREIAVQCCNRMPSWQNDYAMSRIMELIDASAADAKAEENEACAQFLESTNLSQLPDATALHYARLLKGFAEGIRARKENT